MKTLRRGVSREGHLLSPCGPWLSLQLACVLIGSSLTSGAEVQGLSLSTFSCDVTPPVGHPLCGGWIRPVIGVDDPELAKGIVLRDGGGTYVLCAVDWCELRNDAYELFRSRLAEAAGTIPERVTVHCIHAHDAPITDRRAQEILDSVREAPRHADLAFLDATAAEVSAALRESLGRARRITQVGLGKFRVERVASNRRVPGPGGTIRVRYSATKDQSLRDEPEGLIDPMLRTIAFYDEETLVAAVHYYATHPQSYYGDGRATCDVPGIARERMERDTGVFQLYFTGCAGNITAGKYNDGAPERRAELTERVRVAMAGSLASIERRPVTQVDWRVRRVVFPLRKEQEQTDVAWRKVLENPEAPSVGRIQAALALSTIERFRAGRSFDLTCLRIGPAAIIHLPGEPFVEFQLEAQRLRPDLFVAAAGYADCATGYICTERSYAEGGYEPTASYLDPVAEGYLRNAIEDLLAAEPPPEPGLLSVRRIWDTAPHNAFTDLIRHRGRWFCTFREGAGHVSPEATIRVISSPDGESWESSAVFSEAGMDLRDPKLCATPDGRLMLLADRSEWKDGHEQTYRPWVSFSGDGVSWGPPRPILSDGEWLWRVTWVDGNALGVAYRKSEASGWASRLYSGADGVEYERIADFSILPGLTEATLRPGEAGLLHCLHRRDAGTRTAILGTSPRPWTDWAWKDSGFHLGGPNAVLHDGRWYAAGRWVVGAPRTVLARLRWDRGTLEPALELPSGGDTSYAGLASLEKELWMSYYSSHQGKAAIYLAKVAFR